MLKTAEDELIPRGLIAAGEVLGLVAGTKFTSGATNFMRLHTVGENDGPPASRNPRSKA
jgi:pyruvate kinase